MGGGSQTRATQNDYAHRRSSAEGPRSSAASAITTPALYGNQADIRGGPTAELRRTTTRSITYQLDDGRCAHLQSDADRPGAGHSFSSEFWLKHQASTNPATNLNSKARHSRGFFPTCRSASNVSGRIESRFQSVRSGSGSRQTSSLTWAKLTKVAGKQNESRWAESFGRWAGLSQRQAQASHKASSASTDHLPKTRTIRTNTGVPFADFMLGYPVSALTQTGLYGQFISSAILGRWWASGRIPGFSESDP